MNNTHTHLYETMVAMRDRMEAMLEWGETGKIPSTLADDYGVDAEFCEVMAEYPLELVDARGRNFAVVLTVGGPHVEVEAEGCGNARLCGYWAGETVKLSGDVFNWIMDYYIDRY